MPSVNLCLFYRNLAGKAYAKMEKRSINMNNNFNTGKSTFDKIAIGPPVRHTLSTPFLIIGHGRSGTSIIAALCRIYLGIGIGTESQFFIRYFKKLHRYGDLNHDDNVRMLIADICCERFFDRSHKFAEFKVDQKKAFNNLQDRTFSGVLDAIFTQLATNLGTTRWGDKTPEYIHDLVILKQLFPDAQFVHMVRDGRDVAMSSIKEPVFSVNNIYTAAKEWRKNIYLAREFLEQLPSGQFTEVRYEDLLTNPVKVLESLLEFSGIKDDNGAVKEHIRKHINEDIRTNNFNKWKTQLSESQIDLYEQVAGDMLRFYNYETRTNSTKKINPLKAMMWEFHSQFCYITEPRVWGENFNNAKFRVKNLLLPWRKTLTRKEL